MAKKNINWSSSDEEPDFKSKVKVLSDMEEGELSSDDDDNDNESKLEKLFKNAEDRQRIMKMSEVDREEAIFNRTKELEEMKDRKQALKTLNEQKQQQQNSRLSNKKRSFADVFGGVSSDDESFNSSSSNDSAKRVNDGAGYSKMAKRSPVMDRQRALDNQKKPTNEILSQLNQNRKERKEKLEKYNKEQLLKKQQQQPIGDSDSSDTEEKKLKNVDRQSIISSSSSDHFDEFENKPVDKLVENVEQLSKIKLSRHRLEKWVHMPFFKDLAKGCYVRVNIGEGPGVVPIYRIAEVIDVVETIKVYDLGKTRTNAGLKLRIGNSITTFRLLFVSNQNFLESEFESWRRRVLDDNFSLPKLSFIEEKAKQLQDRVNFSIDNEETMQKVLESKKRFQKDPVNFAMKKAELTRRKLAAENEGDQDKANKIQEEIDDLNDKMEKLERKRTEGIKNISYINQRNRENTEKDIEKAIELEKQENLEWEKRGGDPFVREPTKPVLKYKKKKVEETSVEEQQNDGQISTSSQQAFKAEKSVKIDDENINNSTNVADKPSLLLSKKFCEPKININNIHNFELNLDIKVDVSNSNLPKQQLIASDNHDDSTLDVAGSIIRAINNSLGTVSSSSNPNTNSSNQNSSTSRRVLNLSDYKQRKGLI